MSLKLVTPNFDEETIDTISKGCGRCMEVKPLADFYKSKRDGSSYYCKPCSKQERKEYASRNPDKIRAKNQRWAKDPKRKEYARKYVLKREYGLSLDNFYQMMKDQNGLCLICDTVLRDGAGGYAVDHCHKTGFVRGILCQPCNSGLGMFKDNTDSMKRAIKYLQREEQ